MIQSINQKGISGAIWATVDRFGSMAMQFTVNLILARLLLPKDFGIIGMLAIFIAISQTLIDGGFSSALIQKKNPTQADFSTILFWNIGFSVFLYLILFVLAPLIATFFKLELLCSVLRIIALSLIVNGITSIQRTQLQKNLAFKTIAIVNLCSYFIGAIFALIMAKYGFGVWSLVGLQLVYGCCSIVLLWITTKWNPSITFSIQSMKELFGFGGFLMAANLLQTVCTNIQGILIGKKFSATQMGYYSQAYKLDQVTSYSIPQVIVQVMYPIYSSLQDNLPRLNKMVLMNMRVIAFLVFPILATLILIAEPLICFLYGVKWLPAVPYFRIFCIGGFFVSLQSINFYAVAAVGKSKDLFCWSFYKWGFMLISLLIGMFWGMYGILWAMVLGNINIFFTNALLAQSHTGLRVLNQFLTILPILITVVICTILGFVCSFIIDVPFLSAVISVVAYIALSIIFDLKAIHDTKVILMNIFFKNKLIKND